MSNHFFRPLRLTIRRAAVPLVAFAMIALPGSALAQGKDDMWEITSKMEMPGMPMAMPAQTIRQCVAKNAKDDDKFINLVDPKWSGALPALFLYDRTGRKVKMFVGETPMKELEAAVSKLLASPR